MTPAPVFATDADLPSAGLLRRFAAMGYDSILLIAVLAGATVLWLAGQAQWAPAAPVPELPNNAVINELPDAASGPLYRLWLLAVIAAFYCYFWRKTGQTLGMQTWRLRLQTAEGDSVSLQRCLIRLGAALVSWLCLGAGYWWLWIDRDGLTWHDRWSKTRVVLLPRDKKASGR